MKAAVIVFPGSNCDQDMFHALEQAGFAASFVWHKQSSLSDCDLVTLPGGFSYGDYLRSGAIARFSPIMKAVIAFAESGKPVLGVCNGFQTLVEAGLLPGALLKNAALRFVCRQVYLKTENRDTVFTHRIDAEQLLKIPVAHGEGCYIADQQTVERLEENRQVVFRYVRRNNSDQLQANPNGSMNDIAGIINERGNVLGMMPHPERAIELLLGSADGRLIFDSLASRIEAVSV